MLCPEGRDARSAGTAPDRHPLEVHRSLGAAGPALEIPVLRHESPPRVVSRPIADGARISGRWQLGPFESDLPGPEDHVLVTTLRAEGTATWRTSIQTLDARLTPGAFTLVPCGHDGHWRVSGAGIYRGLSLGPARLSRCAEELGRGRQSNLSERLQVSDPMAFHLMRSMADAAESGAPDRALFLEQLVDLMCLHLLRNHGCVPARLDRPPRGALAPWQAQRVVAYMKDRLDQEISLQDLAQVVRLSRFHFCSAFRVATGSTPHEMLTQLRVDEARRLLTSSTRSISEIALSVGFQTPSAFASRFRKAVGLTPREFRRSRRLLTACDAGQSRSTARAS